MLLHGEQYLSIKGPIPVSGTLVSETRIMEALDKGKAAAVTTISTTTDKATGEVVFENQSTVFIRGAGGFGGKKTGIGSSFVSWRLSAAEELVIDRGAATALNKPPSRAPDYVAEEKTLPIQAALYRLSGDYNPLHVSPRRFACRTTAADSFRCRSTPTLPLSVDSTLRFCTDSASSVSRASTSSPSTERSRTSRFDSSGRCTPERRFRLRAGRKETRSSSVSFRLSPSRVALADAFVLQSPSVWSEIRSC